MAIRGDHVSRSVRRRLFALSLPETAAQQCDNFLLNLGIVQQAQKGLFESLVLLGLLISSSVWVRFSTAPLCTSIKIPIYQYVGFYFPTLTRYGKRRVGIGWGVQW